ncbi:MAG: Sec-independent protein translocase protein TatB [Proteobacteria bacterium]|nr:Sec-independent protein translocase protein TatB [Pseudomonadota bacterium]
MFDIGFPELILVAVVGLLVIGPERLPETLRTLGLWFGRMRRSFLSVKTEIEKEIGMDEVRRQLHNESIMEEMKRIEAQVKKTTDGVSRSINDTMQEATIHPSPKGHTDAAAEKEAEAEVFPTITDSSDDPAKPSEAGDTKVQSG